MGTWPSWTSARDFVQSSYAYSFDYIVLASTNINNAWTHYYSNQDHAAIYDILLGMANINWAVTCAITIHNDMSDNFATVWCLDHLKAQVGGVDMPAILNAMLAAKFEELQKFIGIEDAYRVALWNAPFNADFYAALARGFQKWP